MKLKLSSIVIILFLFISGINVNATNDNDDNILKDCMKDVIVLSQINYEFKEEYISLSLDEATSLIQDAGKPMLPVVTKTFTFPLGTKIENIECTFSDISEEVISSKIMPAPRSKPLLSNDQQQLDNVFEVSVEDEVVYSSDDLFPENDFEYTIGCGIKDDENVIFISVNFYPVRYSPASNTIYSSNNFDISIEYEEPIITSSNVGSYDMVIITPKKFSQFLTRFVIHKNLNGIKTKIKTTESIYLESLMGRYDERGRDKPEQIKYFIKYAKENWGIKYVLLVGGRDHQKYSWNVPVRYSNLNDRSFWNESFVTDLYYSDIYRYNYSLQTNEFDDWDSNGNGIFAEYSWIWDGDRGYWYDLDTKDILDLYPDVYIGRLACRDIGEVLAVTNKIIRYEKRSYGDRWFNDMVLVGGDTVPFDEEDFEGEIENELAASYMRDIGFNFIKLWISNGRLTGSLPVIQAINKGAGFLYLTGHGTPAVWSTHPAGDWDTWIDGLFTFEMNLLKNRNELPVCIVGGCHNSQFTVTTKNIQQGIREYGFEYFIWDSGRECFGKINWVPHCWSWNLVRQRNGGAIAAIGNTGLGWGVGGPNCINYQDGFITSHFFQVYSELSQQDVHNLGMIHAQTLNDYIDQFQPNTDELDRKTVEQWVLLGDPSLRIGGYP